MISDALPDGWGMLLMDRLLRKQGRSQEQISPLDRLAFIGDRAMGALVFEPPEIDALTSDDVQLLVLARETREVLQHEREELLRKLVLIGGSPHGARPKALVNFDRSRNRMSNSEEGAGTPMLVKFPAQNEHKEVCAVEAMYNRISGACGLRVPRAEYFDLDDELSAFCVERFDRADGMRIPMHTAAGAAHVNFRIPQLDYTALLRLTRRMTGDEREVLQAFERCVFNVMFNNRDDHSKNFSFLMAKEGQWQFSPAYDLSFDEGPNGEHQMDICGEARMPARKHLLELAKNNSIAEKIAVQTIERMSSVADHLSDFFEEQPIRSDTLRRIESAVKANRARLI
jgi:serine/threonine-protein kinase HipA